MKANNCWSAISQRPPSTVTATAGDITLELLGLGALFLCFTIALSAWRRLPDTIPAHFNLSGVVDGYANKRSVLYPLPFMGALYIALTILNRFPRIFNYPVEITAKNAQIQYRMATRFMRLMKLLVMLTFFFVEYLMILSAFGHHQNAAALWFGPVVLVVILGSVGCYTCRSVKAK